MLIDGVWHDDNLSSELVGEREVLLVEIEDAFGGINREGGISWSECRAVEVYGSAEWCEAARASDLDKDWHELIEDPTWTPDSGECLWSFLDPIGFRYYLPAAMMKSIQFGYDQGIVFHLTLPLGDLREYTFGKWAALDQPQKLCVKHFLTFMMRFSDFNTARNWGFFDPDWKAALESYWKDV